MSLVESVAAAPSNAILDVSRVGRGVLYDFSSIFDAPKSKSKDSLSASLEKRKKLLSVSSVTTRTRRWDDYRRWQLASRGQMSFYAMQMEATAYEPGPRSCGPHATGRTATGMRAGYGVVAVDPRVIPLGTKVFVDGYGYAIAADTGGAIKGNRIDLCYMTVSEALRFGRRMVKVYILGR